MRSKLFFTIAEAAAPVIFLAAASQLPVSAKSVSEALSDMSGVGGSDPHGFTLMIVCIGILFTLAVGTMIATFMYAFKGKKTKVD